MSFGPRRPPKSEGLGLLFEALGGTAAVARMFGRYPSTVAKWCTGALPIPAEIAAALREEAISIASSLQNEAFCLKFDEIPRAEQRAAHGLARRRQAFSSASGYGRTAIRRGRSGYGRGGIRMADFGDFFMGRRERGVADFAASASRWGARGGAP